MDRNPYEDTSLEKWQVALAIAGGLAAVVLCVCGGCWGTFMLFTKPKVSITGDETVMGPNGDEIGLGPNDPIEQFPVTIALELGTEFGSSSSRTPDGELVIPPDQNCRVGTPMSCDGEDCRGKIRVTGPGLCVYRIRLESDPGGEVTECRHRIFATSAEEYRKLERRFGGLDGDAGESDVQVEVKERCPPDKSTADASQ